MCILTQYHRYDQCKTVELAVSLKCYIYAWIDWWNLFQTLHKMHVHCVFMYTCVGCCCFCSPASSHFIHKKKNKIHQLNRSDAEWKYTNDWDRNGWIRVNAKIKEIHNKRHKTMNSLLRSTYCYMIYSMCLEPLMLLLLLDMLRDVRWMNKWMC